MTKSHLRLFNPIVGWNSGRNFFQEACQPVYDIRDRPVYRCRDLMVKFECRRFNAEEDHPAADLGRQETCQEMGRKGMGRSGEPQDFLPIQPADRSGPFSHAGSIDDED